MKKTILLLTIFATLKNFAQSPAPPLINYQGVARNNTGVPIINQTIGIVFELIQGTITGSVSYTETQAITTNSLGLFTTQIGKINSLAGLNWQNGPYFLRISMDASGGTNYIPLGQPQQLVSVPYALYAEKAGNGALPNGTRDGQTMRWDSIAQVWKVSNNLINNETRVSIGLFPNEIKSKMHVTTLNTLDSAAFTAVHLNTQSKQAAVKAFAVGITNSNTVDPYGSAIYGSQNAASNFGDGLTIGSLNYGVSKGFGVGVAGFGSSKTAAGTSIGVYGTTDQNSIGTNKYAALFDIGGVFITDSLMLGSLTNPGNIGDVLTKTSNNGRGTWMAPLTGSGPFTNSANYIHASTSFINSRILFGIPFTGSVGYQSRVTIVNPTSISSDTALIVLQKNNTKPAIYASILPSNTSLSPAIFGEVIGGLNGTTAGVYGKANFNHGVIGYSGNFNGVWGQSPNGVGVSGESTGNGQAGRFNLTSSTSSLPAVYIATNSDFGALKAETFGKGATIIAINSCSVGGSNNQALLIENGHIKAISTSAMLAPTTITTSTFPSIASTVYTITNNSDVRGTVIIDNSSWTGFAANTYLDVSVPFKKMYSGSTTSVFLTPVTLTPNTDKFSYSVAGQNNSSFIIRIKNNTASTISYIPGDYFVINYFVIE